MFHRLQQWKCSQGWQKSSRWKEATHKIYYLKKSQTLFKHRILSRKLLLPRPSKRKRKTHKTDRNLTPFRKTRMSPHNLGVGAAQVLDRRVVRRKAKKAKKRNNQRKKNRSRSTRMKRTSAPPARSHRRVAAKRTCSEMSTSPRNSRASPRNRGLN